MATGGQVMATTFNASRCRELASYFKMWSATCASPSTRDRLNRIARSWVSLALEVERRSPGPEVSKKRPRPLGQKSDPTRGWHPAKPN
jgi:hypothetical protein